MEGDCALRGTERAEGVGEAVDAGAVWRHREFSRGGNLLQESPIPVVVAITQRPGAD